MAEPADWMYWDPKALEAFYAEQNANTPVQGPGTGDVAPAPPPPLTGASLVAKHKRRAMGGSSPEIAAAEQQVKNEQIAAALSGLPAGVQRFSDLINSGQVDIQEYLRNVATDPSYAGSVEGLSPAQIGAQQKAAAQSAATNARFSSDLSWLDPIFQRQAALVGPSQAAQAQSDAGAIAAQQHSYQSLMDAAGKSLSFQSPAQQEALAKQWAAVQGGQGAPQFAGPGQQQSLYDTILGQSGGANAGLSFDSGARQQEQYGNLQGIIAGGGADTIEMARRQAQRADQESWLRGQREADMQNLAERGMAGSGAELLATSSANQAAAGRNSLADLQTAAALEERRLGAINSAAGLASTMRGNTIDEQALLNQARTSNWGTLSGLANQMRSADFLEKSYLDKRGLDALTAQTDLANQMRGQQASEQIAQGNLQAQNLGNAANIANQARSQTWNENFGRGQAADTVAQLNAAAVNSAASANQQHLSQGYQAMQEMRQQAALAKMQMALQTGVAMTAQDIQETLGAFNQSTNIAGQTAGQFNTGNANYNGTMTGTGQIGGQNLLNATIGQNNAAGNLAGAVGNVAGDIVAQASGMGGAAGGQNGNAGIAGMAGAAGGTAGAAGGATSAPQQTTQVGQSNWLKNLGSFFG